MRFNMKEFIPLLNLRHLKRLAAEENLEDIRRFYFKGQEWLKKAHEEGLAGVEFGQAHADLMDKVIRRLLRIAGNSSILKEKISLAAIGGYGREELSPCSDIDLLILHLPGREKNLDQWVKEILYPLWDWGLKVGYTIRTLKEKWQSIQKDLPFFLSLLDARWVAGEKTIFYEWEREFWEAGVLGKEPELILKIRQKAQERHKRHGDSVFILEPEIKEGKGGLRDYHAARSVAKLRYRLRGGRELAEKGILSEKEWHILKAALNFLWRVRNQLHYLYNRKEDRLFFEDQEKIALLLGYRAPDSFKATESFLQDYFRYALHLHQISFNLIEKCLHESSSNLAHRPIQPTAEILPGFSLYHGKLVNTDPSRFDRNPLELWQAFTAIHQFGVEMDTRLKEIISGQLEVIGEKFRTAPESINSFWSFFEEKGNLTLVLETMHETGFLQKFLPEFEKIYCQVQYDRYHLFPVDIHSIYAVRELENLEKKNSAGSSLLRQIMEEVKDRGLLKLAVLIHDLGKFSGAAHAQNGEDIAVRIGQRLNLSPERIATLRFLVREHLTFAEVAQRRDLNEENLILRLAQKIGDGERLRMLYLLSFADLRAIGPAGWSVWKDTLMQELFIKTMHILERGESLGKDDQEVIEQRQREIMELLNGQIAPRQLATYLVNIPVKNYLFAEAPTIAQQILMAEKLADQTLVMEGEEKIEKGYTEITIVAHDEPGLFGQICGVLTANLLNILSAQISTWDNGIAVDQFQVQELIAESILRAPRWTKLQEELKDVLEKKIDVPHLWQGLSLPLFQKFYSSRYAARVEVDNETSDFYTIVEVYANDRPGLLYQIAQKIFALGLNIWRAKISTKVDQVVDVFYIQDLSGGKVIEEKQITKIREEILAEVQNEIGDFCRS